MKVKYIKINTPESVKYKINWQIHYSDFPLILDKTYTVYAVEFTKEKKINFFLLDEGGNTYPNNYPSEFFLVTDPRLSKHWIGIENNKVYPIQNSIYPNLISFKEWKENNYFEEEMLDNANSANDIFQKYKTLLDNEYPDNLLKSANVIEGNWVMCTNCDEAWESFSIEGIISCPNCQIRLNNPYWVG